jgi:hypothetical protein
VWGSTFAVILKKDRRAALQFRYTPFERLIERVLARHAHVVA